MESDNPTPQNDLLSERMRKKLDEFLKNKAEKKKKKRHRKQNSYKKKYKLKEKPKPKEKEPQNENATLRKKYPKLVEEFHPTLNKEITPDNIKWNSIKRLWWKCKSKKCGKNFKATIKDRVDSNIECHRCEDAKESVYLKRMEKEDPLLIILREQDNIIRFLDKNFSFFLKNRKHRERGAQIRTKLFALVKALIQMKKNL